MIDRDFAEFRAEIRAEIAVRLAPFVMEMDEKDELPPAVAAFAQEQVSRAVSEVYGGGGASLRETCVAMEEIAYVCPAVAPYVEAGLLFSDCIQEGGNDSQREEFLGRVASGSLGAFALTDEGAGSSPKAMKTSCRQTSDGLRIFGRKRHITFVDLADFLVCFASEEDRNGGVSAFLFERPFDNIELGKRSEWIGLRGHSSWELLFNGAIPRERLGAPGRGLAIGLAVLAKTRISLASGFVGLAQAALDTAIEFSCNRMSGRHFLSNYQGVSFPLADAQTELDAARLVVMHSAQEADLGRDCAVLSAKAKLLASRALLMAINTCTAVLGGEAGNRENDSGRYLRDAHSWFAAQGTDNIQRIIIARSLFTGRPSA